LHKAGHHISLQEAASLNLSRLDAGVLHHSTLPDPHNRGKQRLLLGRQLLASHNICFGNREKRVQVQVLVDPPGCWLWVTG
jgi:hypothetical protein